MARAAASKKSTSDKTMKQGPGRGARKKPGVAPRAHRNDTPEARQQRAGMAKTHPTRNVSAVRHERGKAAR